MRLAYALDHPHDQPPREMKGLLGGKGANLAEMASVLGMPVPPGFTITTEACRAYLAGGWPDGLDDEVADLLVALEGDVGRALGDAGDPLLVSVRSGATFSMPGMMDTVLNLGLNDRSVEGLAAVTGDRRFAYASYHRFLTMFGRIALGVDGDRFDAVEVALRAEAGPVDDASPGADVLAELCARQRAVVEEETDRPFPQDPTAQLRAAIEAVFRSWHSDRARAYRARERIADDLGTAVTVQAMVFGNRDDESGTGVGFTRDPATGAPASYGDFLANAQGEDVVAGIRNTDDLDSIAERFPGPHAELLAAFARLERHERDMCDVEFTIEQGRLWFLQARVGKRSGTAALRMAVDMVAGVGPGSGSESAGHRWCITIEEALERLRPDHLEQVLHPQLARRGEVLTVGRPASPGAGVGRAVFTAADAVVAARRGERVVLVRAETSPDDVEGMLASEAIVTSRGGLVSHAAVVARGWGKPAVVGADAIVVEDRRFRVGDVVVVEGDPLSVDGTTGEVMRGELPLTPSDPPAELATVLAWADEVRAGHLGVRANADTEADAAAARRFGAEGVGLCRTEHMFLSDDRLPAMRRMILADSPAAEAAALAELRVVQEADFTQILRAMDGLPVTVRLLDPPLHEFLPHVEELELERATAGLDADGERLLAEARRWAELNPMLGTRGVRLAVLKPGLYTMQVEALAAAALTLRAEGRDPVVEVMIPLTVARAELALARRWVEEAVETATAGLDRALAIAIGTMVETPRAALRAGELAEVADFFSFGTNDLTQMCFGFSRDDVEARLVPAYLDRGLLARNPFETVDRDGVGELIRLAVERGRATNPDLKLGACGEHGGDPESIAFFLAVGLDYVSCSPYRVPIARLAAAHAVLAARSATPTSRHLSKRGSPDPDVGGVGGRAL